MPRIGDSAGEIQTALSSAIAAERLVSARRLNRLRVIVMGVLLAMALVLESLNVRPLEVYVACTVVIWLIGHRWERLASWTLLAIPLLDVPFAFAIQHAVLHSMGNPLAVSGFGMAYMMAMVLWSACSLESRLIFLTAAVAAALEVLLQHEAGGGPGTMFGGVGLLLVMALSGTYATYRIRVLMRTAALEQVQKGMLYEVSMLDEVTGLFNRRYFNQSLMAELKRAERFGQALSMLALDLDDFKKVNDTWGHAVGDLVLKALGDVLTATVRVGIDIPCRTGGEEFIILLPATSAESAVILAERVRNRVDGQPVAAGTRTLRMSVSIGVATYPIHATESADLLKRADQALYAAKRLGKNRFCLADPMQVEGKEPLHPVMETRVDNLNLKDGPTGLFNFSYFCLRLREEFCRSGRYPTPVSLIVLQLDGKVDDAARVSALHQLGVLIRTSLREGIDTPARLPNHELAIIVPETPVEAATILGDRLRKLIEATPFPGELGKITVSVGISSFPALADSENAMLEQAVTAAHEVHERGGNGLLVAPRTVPLSSEVKI
ncbi:MAG: diguanylate cyclase [Candidatus Xenobia bacterium]